jgi:excisionase family DNA binding protein
MESRCIGLTVAASKYRISRTTLYRWNREGRLPFYKDIGVKQMWVRADELEAALTHRHPRGRPPRLKNAEWESSRLPEESNRRSQVINFKEIQTGELFGGPVLWVTATTAADWYRDAVSEYALPPPGSLTNIQNIRREIVAAVFCAESYLFEWVRDEALNLNIQLLSKYFRRRSRRGVREKWEDVLRLLHADGKIPVLPDFGGNHGSEWNRLIDYRDGLIHAAASRPKRAIQVPMRDPSLLAELPSGWAVRIVTVHIWRLHKAAGTPPPDWLVHI